MTRTTKIVIAAAGAVVLVCAGALTFVVGTPDYYSGKYEGPSPRVRPTAAHTPLVPEKQTEPHTCGFHALSSVYTSYGLSPETTRLRFRLGTDKQLNLLAPDSTGTIHPDILRVLAQDGFDTELLNPSRKGAAEQVRSHLEAGHTALVLVKVSSLHWIVAAGVEGDEALVCDSLSEGLQREKLDALMARAYSIVLMEPAP